MDLTKRDRVILINQYRILALIDEENSQHYRELIQILEAGYSIFYDQVSDFLSDSMPVAECRFVLDILSIYSAIEHLKQGSPDCKTAKHTYSYFRGFDGNNENKHMCFAQFLILKQGKFAEQKPYLSKNDNLNSHSPNIEIYAKMIRKWEALDKPYKLTDELALEILCTGWPHD